MIQMFTDFFNEALSYKDGTPKFFAGPLDWHFATGIKQEYTPILHHLTHSYT